MDSRSRETSAPRLRTRRPRSRPKSKQHQISIARVFSLGEFSIRLLKKAFSTACALTLVSPEAGEKVRKEASFYAGCRKLANSHFGIPRGFSTPCYRSSSCRSEGLSNHKR